MTADEFVIENGTVLKGVSREGGNAEASFKWTCEGMKSETIAHLRAKKAEEYAEWARSSIDGVVDVKVTADGVVVSIA